MTHDTAPGATEREEMTGSFQSRVQPWLMACFGPEISGDREERNHRFLEEALELVQATGCTASEAHQLVDYVFARPWGVPILEIGGVMVTLAALCLAHRLDMHEAGEFELTRVWTKVEAIRAKQAAKPKYSPLPEAARPAAPTASPPESADMDAAVLPCDVLLAPATVFRKGVKLSTLLLGMDQRRREDWSDEAKTITREPRAKDAGFRAGVEAAAGVADAWNEMHQSSSFAHEAVADIAAEIRALTPSPSDAGQDADVERRDRIIAGLKQQVADGAEVIGRLRAALREARRGLLASGYVGAGEHGVGDPEINRIDAALHPDAVAPAEPSAKTGV